MSTNRLLVAAVLATAIGAPFAVVAGDTKVTQPMTSTGVRVPFLHRLPRWRVVGQSELVLSSARTSGSIRRPSDRLCAGKSSSSISGPNTCINWLRRFRMSAPGPRNTRIKGLVVIGVHAPEFAFEKNIDNVRWAVKDMRIDYPVAVDNDHAIWRAFKNKYWPALYFVDAQGRIRHHQFGEGAYEQSEMIIQAIAGRGRSRRHRP